MAIKLRDYQLEAIEALREHLRAGRKRILLVAPTGAGKTTIASEIIRSAMGRGKRVLFLAHRIELINQCSARLDQFEIPHGIIRANDERKNDDALVQVASVQTLIRRNQQKFDLIVIDEAHRSLADSYKRVLEAQEGASVIGLTATPCRTDGKGLGEAYNAIVETCSVGALVEKGVLVPAQVWGAREAAGLENISTVAGDYNRGQLAELMTQSKLIGDVVGQYIDRCNGEKTVVFAVNVAHSIALRDRFIQAGVKAAHIDGTTPEDERAETLRKLRTGAIEVVTNCSILTEGWDLPDLGCVQIARPTKSLALYLQMVGRGLRASPGKKHALILDHGGCFQRFGHPLDDRQWGLDATKRHGNSKSQPGETGWQCKNCWYVNDRAATECEECGVFKVLEKPKEIKESKDELVLLEQRVSRVVASGDRWLLPYARLAPTMENKIKSHRAIAAEWVRRGKIWKVQAIATKYRNIWGVWPCAEVLQRSGYQEEIKSQHARDAFGTTNIFAPWEEEGSKNMASKQWGFTNRNRKNS
jgi:superfamily II DNA or RNA helicase